MAIKKSFNGRSLLKPGAYSKFKIDNSAGASLTANEVLFLVGESTKGAPGSTTGILEFNSARIDSMIDLFGEGPLVDAAIASVRPSTTPGVGGAGKILVYKTNASTQASANLIKTTNQILVKGVAWGVEDNNLAVVVANGSTANKKIVSVTKISSTTEVLGENEDQSILNIIHDGDASSATITIAGASRNDLILTSTLTGQTDGSLDLNIPLAGKSMKELVDIVNAQVGYTATLLTPSRASTPASDLDAVTSVGLLSLLVLKRLQKEIVDLLNTSTRVEATETAVLDGLPDNQNVSLAGGAQGASTNATFSTALAVSLAQDYSVLVPCVSRDAATDIADAVSGFTDAASTYTISSILAATSAHLTLRGDTKNRKEAQAMVGVKEATKAAAFLAISAIADANIQAVMQDMILLDASGTLKVAQPHVLAAALAGIRLGTTVGEPLTNKFVRSALIGHNINPTTLLETGDFNTALDGEEAIENGITFCEKRGNGFRVVVDNTTYGVDDSFVFNRGSVLEASYFTFKTIRNLVESLFVGQKVSNGAALSIKNAIRNKLRELNQTDVQILTSSIDAPEGFREDTFVVTIDGNTARVQVEIKPVQGLDFVLLDFTLGNISQSA